jgi:hypothetical protein
LAILGNPLFQRVINTRLPAGPGSSKILQGIAAVTNCDGFLRRLLLSPPLPRLSFRQCCQSCGDKTSSAGRKRFISSLVNSRTSPDLSVSGFIFIISNLPSVSFAKTDNPHTTINGSEVDYMQPHSQKSQGDDPGFRVIHAVILIVDSRLSIKINRPIKRQGA